jgi:hypothetical protein
MDDLPPRPVRPRATQTQGPWRQVSPPPARQPSHPIGAATGFLLAGVWAIFFTRWFALSGAILWIVGGLGFVLVSLGLIFAGMSVDALLDRRHPRG